MQVLACRPRSNPISPQESSFEYLRLPLKDMNTESVLEYLPKAVEFLQRARVRADGCVLVHCNEGKSRSASIIIGYLIQVRPLDSPTTGSRE